MFIGLITIMLMSSSYTYLRTNNILLSTLAGFIIGMITFITWFCLKAILTSNLFKEFCQEMDRLARGMYLNEYD